jgi:glycosyltransferase involved in cell wall biosynthesis
MRVGIDGGCWNVQRGYGRFLQEILGALARNGGGNDYTVFLDPVSYAGFRFKDSFRAIRVETSRPISEAATARGSRSVIDLLRMSRATAREHLDLFFFPSVYTYFPLFRRIPTVLGIHDIIPDRNPQFAFHSWRQHLFWRWKNRTAVTQADAIITVSEYSKRGLQQLHRVPSQTIHVLHEAVSSKFRKIDVRMPQDRYVLYVGGINPHKNLRALISAFAKLRARSAGLKLMLVGDYLADRFVVCYPELKELATRLGVEEDVVFTGYVPDEELCVLYNRAALFVLPSFEEGFGLPALEAMACGVPVVISTGSALEEVAGDAGVPVDPHDESALTAAMDRILGDRKLADELAEKSLRRASQFSWDDTAAGLLKVCEDTWRQFHR